MSPPGKRVTVAAYLDAQIAMSDKSQRQIADEVGYDRPNVITMIKQGRTKLPINKVGPFAKALGVDPVHLLRITMSEYMPDTWATIEKLIGHNLVTANELRIIEVIREASGGLDVELNEQQMRDVAKITREARRTARLGR